MQNDCLYWPGGRKKAVTFSYDDGITQDIRLIHLFNEYGVKGTFNLNPRLFGAAGKVSLNGKTIDHIKNQSDEIAGIYRNHEIAGHGEWHTSMATMDTARCADEILNCRRDLESLLGRMVTGYAYAFGVTSENIRTALCTSGIRSARTIASTGKFDIPQDFLMWNPTCHHDDEKLFEYADVERIATRGLELRLAGLDASSQFMLKTSMSVPMPPVQMSTASFRSR